ncbi:MAG: phosphoribosylaminoimidazolesuccinocarboxamide synthase [Chloroflexi bacterium]|nr:phosphoribosylaminoimidazolesuccinocarboxamide synthase [Chloroflexota bacterium]
MLITTTNLPLPVFSKGKVRDIYDLGDQLLVVTTDRMSAFDVVLPNPIPDKSKVLNLLSAFWFEKTAGIIPNHVIKVIKNASDLRTYNLQTFKPSNHPFLAGRAMVVKKANRVPVECVVRGYLSGSAWAEYKQKGAIGGMPWVRGLEESQRLERPIFTPTTKAETGHDMPLNQEDLESLVGKDLARSLEEKAIAVYDFAREYALDRDIIIADTKMEFGHVDGQLILIDELLTPDSSRFWPLKSYVVGRSQQSFDKQPLRDWLEACGWNKEPPPPELPPEVIEQTAKRYREAFRLLTGKRLK